MPRPGLPRLLFLPGAFPNKVREGKVPSDRPATLRPSPGPIAVAAARSRGRPSPWSARRVSMVSWCWFSTPAGVPPSEEQNSPRDPPPFALLQSGRLSAELLSRRASLLPRPASPGPHRFQVRRAGGGGAAAPSLPRGLSETGSGSLSSL